MSNETVNDLNIEAADLLNDTVGEYELSQLDALESESIHIFREVTAELERPVLLFSGGKDSVVMLHLARKAFWPAPVPFPVMHVDTGHNFPPEVIEYRDRTVEKFGLRLVVASVQDYIDDGRLSERPDGTRNPLQTMPLLDAISHHASMPSTAVAAAMRRRPAPRSAWSRCAMSSGSGIRATSARSCGTCTTRGTGPGSTSGCSR